MLASLTSGVMCSLKLTSVAKLPGKKILVSHSNANMLIQTCLVYVYVIVGVFMT